MRRDNGLITVGFVIDWIPDWVNADYIQTRILSEVGKLAQEYDVHLICFVAGRLGSPFEWERSRNILFNFIRREHLDGLLIIPSINIFGPDRNGTELLKRFDGIPVVTINDQYENYHCVAVDNRAGMRQIVDHIIETHGRRRIVFLKGPDENNEAKARFEAYLDSLRNHQIAVDPKLIIPGLLGFDSGGAAARALLEQRIDFDAIIAANDNMAIGAMIELEKQLGKVPENISFAGFDDTEASRCLDLTTVRQSFEVHARAALSALLRIIRGEEAPRRIEIPTEQVIRTSCGCLVTGTSFVFDDLSSAEIDTDNLLFSVLNDTFSLLDKSNVTDRDKVREWMINLWTALQDGAAQDGHSGFLSAWRVVSFRLLEQRVGLPVLHDLLSIFRKYTGLNCREGIDSRRIENLFHVARIQLCEANNRFKASSDYRSALQFNKFNQMSEALIAELNIDNQMRLLADHLPQLGIHQCFIVLYEDPENPLGYARLIQGFTHNKCFVLDREGRRFSTLDLLPEDMMGEMRRERFNVVIQALHHGDHQLGYVIFGFDGPINSNYEIIRYRLSMALKGTLLLEKIRGQAESLENQVIERTQDLARINHQLVQEIAKRKGTEAQLKDALKKLANYNHELHHRSIRDELTGLYNRRGFMELGSKHFIQARKTQTGFLILYADLDNLKQINDRFGHSEGDQALIRTAQIFDQLFSADDILARLSGDEFTIIIAEATFNNLAEIQERLYRRFEINSKHSRKPYELSVSIGGAFYDPKSEYSFEEILRTADESLYLEKLRRKECRVGS